MTEISNHLYCYVSEPAMVTHIVFLPLFQCYKDLGQRNQAKMMCDAASDMKLTTKDVGLKSLFI